MCRARRRVAPRRIATISLHTSPLDQPGTGDAGGLNVYVVEVAKQLASRDIEVEIFTRAVCPDTPATVELVPGVLVRNVVAGPFEELDKNDLPGQICPFTFGVLRTEAAFAPGRYDLLHAHYWLSGQVAAVAAERWGVPLIQSMHTLGKVKNLALASDDCAEPAIRIRGEGEVVAAADRLVANTTEEARQLVELYGASPWRVETVSPGVDLSVFRAGPALEARRRLGLPADAVVLVFAGRIQPLKGPDIVLHAAAELLRSSPALADKLMVVFVGGPSGSEVGAPGRLDGPGGDARHLRLRPARAAVPAARAGGLVPGRDGGARAVALGVVRPGGARGSGLRDAGGRRRRRRAAHRRQGRLLRHPGRRARSGGLRAGARQAGRLPRAARGTVPRRAGARVRVRLARHRGPADRGVYQGHGVHGYLGRGRRDRARMTGDPGAPAAAVEAALAELGLPYENPRPGAYLVKLEGQHKLATMTWLVVGAHSLGVEAFFCRQPDENHEAFYRFLLERNGRMYGVHFTLDPVGDVYLTGRLPLSAVSTADIDRLLGCVLSYSDENFDTALELGFGSAIRREWAWRVKRGESLANLRAFARFADPES